MKIMKLGAVMLASATALLLSTLPSAADPIFTPLLLAGLANVGVFGTTASVVASIGSALAVTPGGRGALVLA